LVEGLRSRRAPRHPTTMLWMAVPNARSNSRIAAEMNLVVES
jgi:hypothetical protein